MNHSGDARIRVLLVDDHAIVRAGYRVLLGDAPDLELVAEAGTGELACQRYVEHRPDIVLMDLTLPGIGGLEAARRIIRRDGEARIIVFTMHEESVFVQQALSAGVRGYITKGSAPDVLVDAIRCVMRGERYLDPRLRLTSAGGGNRTAGGSDALESLSPREFSIFRFLAAGASNADIASQLRLSEKTVANYATRILKKLGVQNRAELVYLAVRRGIVTPATPAAPPEG